jgi:cytoskeletal protein CcmA (bactofilin family)
MTIDKKKIRSDIPGHNAYVGHQSAEEARRLIIGRDIVLQGAVSSCDHLQVEGVVEAQTFACRRMDIMETGIFAGMAETQDAVIAGRFEGRLMVRGRLSIKSTGCIYGEVHYGTLDVETGARLEAHIMVLPEAVPAVETPVIMNTVPPAHLAAANDTDADDGDDDGETTKERAGIFRRAVGF